MTLPTPTPGANTTTIWRNIEAYLYELATNGSGGGGSGDMLKATYDPASIAEQLVGLTAVQTLTNKTFGATTFTGLITATQAAANTGILASTGYSLTGADATSMINLAGTLNTSGSPNVIYSNITNTASGANTRLFRLDVGAAHRFSISTGGDIYFAPDSHSLQSFGGSSWGMNVGAELVLALGGGGNNALRVFGNNAINLGGNNTNILIRDGADHVIAMRSGGNAQTFRVYGAGADDSNYVRAGLIAASNLVTLAAESAGSGADDVDINITTAGAGLVNLAAQSATADVALVSTHSVRMKIGGTEYKVFLATP